MLLHLGGALAVNSRRVIAVFDMNSVAGSRETRALLRQATQQNRVERVDDAAPKAFVLLGERDGRWRIVLTPISASTLKLRLSKGDILRGFQKEPAEQ